MSTEEQVGAFRELRDSLNLRKQEMFPRRSVVRVDSPRFHGIGLATLDDGVPPDQLAVRLENGNTWWYPLEHCRLVTDMTTLNRGERRLVLHQYGIKLL